MSLLRLHAFRPIVPEHATDSSSPVAVIKAKVPERPAVSSVQPRQQVAPPVADPEPSAIPAPVKEPTLTAFPCAESKQQGEDWHSILEALKLGGMARELGQHCDMRRLEETRIVLCLSPIHRHLQMKPAQDKLQQALSDYFGRALQLTIDLEEVIGDTPAAAAQRRRDERQDRAVASVEQDDFVREVIDLFDATLIESSIKPV
jgi:DNA polymerase III subunit gamma/tau